jgi:rod shape-determining protein MreC
VADLRLHVAQPIHAAVATALYPVQWLALWPGRALGHSTGYFQSLDAAQAAHAESKKSLSLQSQRAGQVEQLTLENTRLRELMGLRAQLKTESIPAEVLYDAADPYTRKVVVDRGLMHGIVAGAPVIDEAGVLGQVTRVHPLVSEVTLIIDRDQAIPVLNTRTGARSVAFGDPLTRGGVLELRFMAGNADVQVGDILTTSGIDGVYPPGLPVARVERVERRADSGFAKIYCTPNAIVAGPRHVMVLKLAADQIPARPAPVDPTPTTGKGSKR